MSALITLSDIAFSANGRDILHDINFSISRDQILTIVGPNGAGKSTLLSLILGHNRPSRGTISRIKGLKTSFVPQKFHPPADLPITARRFLRDIPQAAKSLWLTRLNIAHLLDTPLQTLSGGETQRLLLARAMLRCPDLIVLDEPAAGIDPVALGDYYQTIRDWQRSERAAVLMVSHDLHLVMAGRKRPHSLPEPPHLLPRQPGSSRQQPRLPPHAGRRAASGRHRYLHPSS